MDRPKSTRMIVVSAILLPMILVIAGTNVEPSVEHPPHQADQATPSPTPATTPTPTPDLDRLLEPTLAAPPSQADIGASDFWLNCLPCHGDMGQGLTDEFRQLYPPEDRSCWDSGCHGKRHSEFAFTLPEMIPPVIGEDILEKYGNAANLFNFIHVTMPWNNPNTLDDEVYWQLVAFLLRENGFENPYEDLTGEKAELIFLGDIQVAEEPDLPVIPDNPEQTIGKQIPLKYFGYYWLGLLAIVFLGMYFFYWTEQGKKK